MPFIGWKLSYCRSTTIKSTRSYYITWVSWSRLKMMKCSSQLPKRSASVSNSSLIKLSSLNILKHWLALTKLLSECKRLRAWTRSATTCQMLRSKIFMLQWLSNLHRENGSHRDRAHATSSVSAIRELDPRKKSLGKNSLSFAMKILLWLGVPVLQSLAFLPLDLKSNTFFKKFCLYSDNYLKMNKM